MRVSLCKYHTDLAAWALKNGYEIPPEGPSRVKVLIVDDEASQRSGLAAMVSAWNMTPEIAADGEEALAKLAEFPADVILTDLNMPGLDGFGLLQRLRDAGDTTPAIVLTAFGNIEKAVQTVHDLGAYWFLDKPIQPSVLEVLIRRAGSHAGLLADKRMLERQLSYKGSLGNSSALRRRCRRFSPCCSRWRQARPVY